jgi:hypothetical protein
VTLVRFVPVFPFKCLDSAQRLLARVKKGG